MAPRLGRPPSDDPRRRIVSIRLTEAEYALVVQAASYNDEPVAVWVRQKATAAAKRAVR
jgi:uncharacterized protein (DUF1778 family)